MFIDSIGGHMNIAAEKIKSSEPALEYGIIEGKTENGCLVSASGDLLEADIAASCLLKPEPGDLVLLSVDGAGTAYVLSILERSNKTRNEMIFNGDLSLEVREGNLDIKSGKNISLNSASGISTSSQTLEISALEGTARISGLSFIGNVLNARIEKIKLVADTVDSILRRAVQRLTSSFRYIEEHEEIQSASTRMLVDGTLTMQTKNTMHTAEGHIKIDAEQIHLG
jgi:hypothetical protein